MQLADGRIVKVTQIEDQQQADRVASMAVDAVARCQARRIPFEDMMVFIADELAPHINGLSADDLARHFLAFPADVARIGAAVLGRSLR